MKKAPRNSARTLVFYPGKTPALRRLLNFFVFCLKVVRRIPETVSFFSGHNIASRKFKTHLSQYLVCAANKIHTNLVLFT